jgi:hypothetical protein
MLHLFLLFLFGTKKFLRLNGVNKDDYGKILENKSK